MVSVFLELRDIASRNMLLQWDVLTEFFQMKLGTPFSPHLPLLLFIPPPRKLAEELPSLWENLNLMFCAMLWTEGLTVFFKASQES